MKSNKISLYNKKNKEQLLDDLSKEKFNRITCSFYKYVKLNNLKELRNEIYIIWDSLNILGRIYLAREGINAQISVPEHHWEKFEDSLINFPKFNDIKIKKAIQEGQAFLKLVIKIKDEIVAYKIKENEFDMEKVGNHLSTSEFNDAIDGGAVVIDIRNYYESEVGKFESAIIPNVDRSEDLLPEIRELLRGYEDEKVLMYCTGGIRCEKASSYLIKNGFNDVNQLKGGIIQYAHDIKQSGDKSKFIGKNFVFDHRLGERITDDIIGKCHQCGQASDNHNDCANQACHILFIQCNDCSDKYSNCCSVDCLEFNALPKEDQNKIIKAGTIKFNAQKSNSTKPKLNSINEH